MVRIEGNLPPGLAPGGFGPSSTAPQTGTFKGEQLTVKDAASVLADAAEEISLHHSEKAESKRHDERRIKAEGSPQQMLVEQINAYLEAARGEQTPEQLAQLAKRMQSSQENPRELARQQSRDPSHQYALLQHALADGQASGASAEALERLQDAIADLEWEAGPQIRAGLNTMGVAREGASVPEAGTFQQTYRDIVLGDATLAQTLKLALDRLGGASGDALAQGLTKLIKALGADLSATRPSTDANRLQALVQDLYQLEVAVTVLDGCRDLAANLAARHGVNSLAPVDLMKDLVTISGEKWVGASRFNSLADGAGARDTGARITFLTATKALLREMPPKVFADGDVRQSILNAAQDALDAAIEREDS